MTERAVSGQTIDNSGPTVPTIPGNAWVWILAILLLGCSLTLTTSSLMRARSQQLSLEEFNRQVDIATQQLESAIEKDKVLIVALQGIMETFTTVTREDFRLFVESVDIGRLFPDTQALSWNVMVPEGDEALSGFEREVRLDYSVVPEGYPEFSVRPAVTPIAGPRYVVKYIEPMASNLGAFGFDIGSKPQRRKTVERARDLDQGLATAPITLVQETGSQKGFLTMLPVYETPYHNSIEERRAQFRGVVVAATRIGNLIASSGKLEFTALQVFDVTDRAGDVAPESIYAQGLQNLGDDDQSLIRQIEVSGRMWELVFTQSAEALSSEGKLSRWAVPVLGGLSTALAALLVGYLATSRQRTLQLAEKLTQDLKLANDELSQSNDDLRQFAHVASHDLQTPVRNIMGSVSMLEDAMGEEPTEDVQLYLQFLKDSATRMRSLITDLLRYAETGQALDLKSVDLNATFALVTAVTKDICEEKAASLHVADMPTVPGDEHQLERVFTNLVTNALKYSSPDRAPVLDVSVCEADGFHEIRVRDNGMGMEAEHLQSVFEPFKRLHRQTDISGTGLGLAICRQIMEKHGGQISVEQSSASGTTVLLTLPIAV